jgi:hypothetical protein
MNYELKIRQSFAKLRRILGSNYGGEGENQECVKREKRGSFYRRGGGSPFFMVVTPILILHDIHAN